MIHPTADELLLIAYDELPEARTAAVEAHIAACRACAEQVAQLERGRVALDLTVPARPRRGLVARTMLGLAAAAVIGAILISRRFNDEPRGVWPRQREWSTHAGYFAGGRAVILIDGQLTRLEQGWSYGRP